VCEVAWDAIHPIDGTQWRYALAIAGPSQTERDRTRAMIRAAVAAMQPEMAAAHEAGRRAGLEEAIAACETERQNWTEEGDGGGAWAIDDCRKAIRALVQPGAATEAGHG